jgi:23S rRNA pseudouridine1911/1915/1917 synthase
MGVSQHVFSSLKVLGGVRVDGVPARADQMVLAGQVITVTMADGESSIEPDPTPVEAVYEDEDILIVNKPAPLPCQSSSRQEGFALENRMAARYGEKYVFRPVNRLDKGTSGLMAVAKHPHSQMLLSRMLHSDRYVREYLAVVVGRPPELEGLVDAPIRKADGATVRREVAPDGKPARTRYRLLQERDGLSLVRLRLETGRTHQIRVHMQHLGCPVWGDFLYGTEVPELPGRFAALLAADPRPPDDRRVPRLRSPAAAGVRGVGGVRQRALIQGSKNAPPGRFLRQGRTEPAFLQARSNQVSKYALGGKAPLEPRAGEIE